MNASMTQIVEELRSQLAPLDVEQSRLRASLAELSDQRRKLEAALKALGEDSPKPRSSRKGKSCATKPEVSAIVVDLLRENGAIPAGDLEALAKERFLENGDRSLSGFRLRFEEVLRGPEFRSGPGGAIELATRPTSATA